MLVGAGIGQADTESTTQPFVFLPTRPLDSEIVGDLPVRHPQLAGDLDGELVGFHLGRPIHITVAAIPELLPFVPLTNVDQFVKDVEIQGPLLPTLQIVQPDHDVPLLVIDVRVRVIRNEVNQRVLQDGLPEAIVLKEALEVSVPIQAWEDLDDRPASGGELAVD